MAADIPEVFTLGHSPDPDDAFMFYALAAHKIDTRGYHFEHILQDIETLNQRAERGELHLRRSRSSTLRPRQICAAAQRREHGRRLRPDGHRGRADTALPDAVKAGEQDAVREWLQRTSSPSPA